MNNIEYFNLILNINDIWKYSIDIRCNPLLPYFRNFKNPMQTLQHAIKINALQNIKSNSFYHHIPISLFIKKEHQNSNGILDKYSEKEIQSAITLRVKSFAQINSKWKNINTESMTAVGLALNKNLDEIIELNTISQESKFLYYKTNNINQKVEYKGTILIDGIKTNDNFQKTSDVAPVYLGPSLKWNKQSIDILQPYLTKGGRFLWEGNMRLKPTKISFDSIQDFTDTLNDYTKKSVLYNANF